MSDPAGQYRAELDFEITFSNGGSLSGAGFRIDIDDPDLTGPALGEVLADSGARLVGIDAINIDDTADPERPAHSLLLAAGIPVCEHLTNLGALPAAGFRFSAVPPRITGFGTFPVRAYATWPA